jgi:hypothetical protein
MNRFRTQQLACTAERGSVPTSTRKVVRTTEDLAPDFRLKLLL